MFAVVMLTLCVLLVLAGCSSMTRDSVDLVAPLIGTAQFEGERGAAIHADNGHGHVFPGPALPNGLVQLSPINDSFGGQDWLMGSGYMYQRGTIMGFAHTNNGHWKYRFLFMPMTGALKTQPGDTPEEGYRSRFTHDEEEARAGYYSVLLQDYDIRAELTSSKRVGVHRYTFPASEQSHIIIDLGQAEATNREQPRLRVVGDRNVEGQHGGYFFHAVFSKPFTSHGTFNGSTVSAGTDEAAGDRVGAYLSFSTTPGETVLAKVGLSLTNVAQAKRNIELEVPGWDFDAIASRGREVWNEELASIDVDGGTAKQRRLFYTCFYRMLQSPYIFNDADGSWNDRGVILKVEHDIVFWDSMWGVFRNKQPLISLLRPELKANILRYMIHWGKHKERMPIYFFGDAAPSYFADAYLQGIDDIDIEQAYELLKKNAAEGAGTTAAREYIDEYLELGYIPHTRMAATAATLEYAHADFCLALLAKALGKDGDYRTFITRARNYRNVFDPTTGFMRGRHADGSWATPFSPTKGSNEVAYREGNAWHYTWFVPHDVHGLIELLGGREAFVTKLDECFSTPWDPADRSSWLTGFLGQYCHGNQPSHQVAYLYNYAGAPWKTQQVVRQIMDLMYGGPPKDLAFVGMDDSGEMSSWYVWSAIGLYPVCPGQRVYVIGSPLFDRITLRLPSYRERRGGDFTIEAHNNSDANRYIQSAILNGQPYDKTWLAAGDIVDGGHLILEMGPEPSSWGSSPESAPPSME